MPTIKNAPFRSTHINQGSTPNNPLLNAASWLAEKRFSKSKSTKDLVTTLLSHGARAWRMSQPRGHVSIKSINPAGYSAVRIKV
ncbi:MAG: hypothetical protein ABJE63_13245 [Lentilitoribacter sp.]